MTDTTHPLIAKHRLTVVPGVYDVMSAMMDFAEFARVIGLEQRYADDARFKA